MVTVMPPAGSALVQTVDILAPVVNDAYAFGRIAAANALSDVYAMGGRPWSAMSIACFPGDLAENAPEELTAVLRGGLDAMHEAECVSAGGHTVKDADMKFGLAVTGWVHPDRVAVNSGFRPGDRLLLTKPVGSGILATAVKAAWEHAAEAEAEITRWCSRLNSHAGGAIPLFGLKGATDITGFGLGGHAAEAAEGSGVTVLLHACSVPLMPRTLDFASDGLVPAGSIRNRTYAACRTHTDPGVCADLVNAVFDAQTSGGLLLSVPPEKVSDVRAYLGEGGDLACEIGEVLPRGEKPLVLVP